MICSNKKERELDFESYEIVMEVYNPENVAFANLVWETNDNEKSFREKAIAYMNTSEEFEWVREILFDDDEDCLKVSFDDNDYDLDSNGVGIYDIYGMASGNTNQFTIMKIEDIIKLEIDYLAGCINGGLRYGYDFQSKGKADFANEILFYNEFLGTADEIRLEILEAISESRTWLNSYPDDLLEEDGYSREYLLENLDYVQNVILSSECIEEIEDTLFVFECEGISEYIGIDCNARNYSNFS